MALKPHHKAWLDSHPDYDEAWLKRATAMGFHVHHIDQDKNNNDPDNLLMIERNDHMKVHGMPGFLNKMGDSMWDSYARRISLGHSAYNMRLNTGQSWLEIAVNLEYKRDAQAINVAKAYAMYHKLEWPIPHHIECKCRLCRPSSTPKKKAAPKVRECKPDEEFVLMCLDDDGNMYPA